MPKILITPAAEDDLINIWVYIARGNPEAADRTYQAAEKTFETLARSHAVHDSHGKPANQFNVSCSGLISNAEAMRILVFNRNLADGFSI